MSNPTCEVCSTESSKYRCPTCALMSCSLGCTQGHKVYCTPKAPSQLPPESQSQSHPESESGISGDINGVNANANANLDINKDINTNITETSTATETTNGQRQEQDDEILFSKAQSLLTSSSSCSSSTLRAHLRDIYRTTLEEEWPEPASQAQAQTQASYSGRGRGGGGGRGRGGSRGRGGNQNRNYGAWTREKGFGRGLGKVRKFRRECEEGIATGVQAEVFMRFVGVVLGSEDGDGDQSAIATATRG